MNKPVGIWEEKISPLAAAKTRVDRLRDSIAWNKREVDDARAYLSKHFMLPGEGNRDWWERWATDHEKSAEDARHKLVEAEKELAKLAELKPEECRAGSHEFLLSPSETDYPATRDETGTEVKRCIHCGEMKTRELRNRDCFIATAAYGTALDSRIDSLRAYRDQYLPESITNFYYAHSPHLASWIDRHKAAKKAARIIIDPLAELARRLTECRRGGALPATQSYRGYRGYAEKRHGQSSQTRAQGQARPTDRTSIANRKEGALNGPVHRRSG